MSPNHPCLQSRQVGVRVLGDGPGFHHGQVGVQFKFVNLVAEELPDVPRKVIVPGDKEQVVLNGEIMV